MKSPEILSVISISNNYNVRPSTILNIEDPYEAYCFDEACMYIVSNIKDGKTPIYANKTNGTTTQQNTVNEMIRLGGELIEY